jgi:hypothetical protein
MTLAAAGAMALAPQLFAANAVVWWNQVATENSMTGSDPVSETRVFAITHLAIHDALNAVDKRYAAYAYEQRAPGASAEAAVAAAARQSLVSLMPSRAAQIEAAYQQALASIPDDDARRRGIHTGSRAAMTILNRRTGDGSEIRASEPAGTQPGEYRPTAPDFTPAFLPRWGKVLPFALRTSSQFRPVAPYKLDSPEYAMDYNEVAAIGDRRSTTRTEEGSEIAMFWYEQSGQGWNRIARVVAEQKGINLWQAARLFALVNIAMADGFIGGFEAKYHFDYWRPSTAIAEADADGNADTQTIQNWLPFLGTPPVPDYPSTHSVLGAAAAKVLARFFGTDFIEFEFTSGAPYPEITRKFWSFSQAAAENGASRILAGIHFRNAVRAGMHQGEEIGEYVYATQLRTIR